MESSPLSALPEDDSAAAADSAADSAPHRPSAFSPAAIPPRPASRSSLQNYAPLQWTDYFDKEDDIAVPGSNDVFHVYTAGSEGPVVFCLHGGGYSGKNMTEKTLRGNFFEGSGKRKGINVGLEGSDMPAKKVKSDDNGATIISFSILVIFLLFLTHKSNQSDSRAWNETIMMVIL